MFWSVIKCDLIDQNNEAKFNTWYNDAHVPRYIVQPGFNRAWRLGKQPMQTGRDALDQQYQAIYEVDNVTSFNDALDRDFEDSHPWEGWETRITNWQRTYYEVLTQFGSPAQNAPEKPRFWTTVRVDFNADSPAEEAEFNDWYNNTHVPDVMSGPGAQRAWRLRLQPDDNDLGERGQKYLAVYESDTADYLREVRSGTTPWDGIWTDKITNWEIGVYQQLFDSEETAKN